MATENTETSEKEIYCTALQKNYLHKVKAVGRGVHY